MTTGHENQESRRHRRFSVDVEAGVALRSGERLAARTRDLSRRGICLITTAPVPVGETIVLALMLSFGENTFSEPLKLRARVVWCTAIMQSFQVGAMFDTLSDEQHGFLEMFVHFLDGTLPPNSLTGASAPEDEEDSPPPPPELKDDPFRS